MNSKAIRKQLLAAVAMVLVAAVALGSSTYAWFAANNEVTATGMSVHAQGESGIVIKGESDSVFTTTGTARSDVSSLKPTSTCDLANWWHAVSDEYDDEMAVQDANKYSSVTGTKSEYVAEHVFTIRSAASDVALTDRKLAVKTVTVTPPTTQQSTNLNKAIRVGVKITTGATDSDPELYIYAPLAGDGGFTLVPNYDSTVSSLTEKKAADSSTDILTLADDTIPANDTGLKATVYVWFEGEDTNCKSSNITASVDNLAVSVVFTAVAA